MSYRPRFDADGRQLAVGEREPDPGTDGARGRARAAPEVSARPCACCGHRFKPTPQRRLLCDRCFRQGSSL